MKRTFLYIAAIAAAAVSCTKAEVETKPAAEENIVYTIPASVVADCGTKAFYGGESGVVAQWEETDQLVTLKGLANSAWPSARTDNAGSLGISSIEGHSAEFRGDVATSYNGKAYWYFVYSKENTVQMSAKSEWVGTLSGTHSFTNAVKVTIPSTQTGERWEPVLFGATNELIADEEAKTATFSVLNACLAIRLFENDKVTPTTADRIVIEPAEEGSFVCGYFEDTCKPTVNEQETQDGDPSEGGTKLVLDASKFHGDTAAVVDTGDITYEPFNGNEYRFSIPAGVNMGDLKVNIYKDGKVTTRTIPAKEVEAGHLRPVKIALDAESDVQVSFLDYSATTTYSAALAGDLEYANNLENRLNAILSATVLVVDGVITDCGFVVDGVKVPVDVNSIEGEIFSVTKEFALGSHTMNAYVTATSITTGKSATASSDNVTFHITGLPYEEVPPQVAGWTGRNKVANTTDSNEKCLYSDNDWGKSPYLVMKSANAFPIPSEINVAISYRARVSNADNRLTLSVQGNGTSRDLSPKYPSSNTTNKFDSGVFQTTMSPEYNYVGLYSNGGLNTKMWLYRMTILYSAGE